MISPVHRNTLKRQCNESRPERECHARVATEIENLKFFGGTPHLREGMPAVRQCAGHHHQRSHRAGDQNEELDHVGPNYSGDAPHPRPQNGKQSDYRDALCHAPASEKFKYQCCGIHANALSEDAANDEEPSGQAPNTGAESVAHVVIGAVVFGFVIARDEVTGDQQARNHATDSELQVREITVAGKRNCRNANKGNGTDSRRDNRGADRIPGDLPTRQEKVMRCCLFAFQPVTNPRCDCDIRRHDEPVENRKIHYIASCRVR